MESQRRLSLGFADALDDMGIFLKIFAWLCKIAAIVFWLYAALSKIELDNANLHRSAGPWGDPDWGDPAFKHRASLDIAQMTVLAVLAILPNRWPLPVGSSRVSIRTRIQSIFRLAALAVRWRSLFFMLPGMFRLFWCPVNLIPMESCKGFPT